MAIINGRRVSVSDAGISGEEIIQIARPRPGRRMVVKAGLEFEKIERSRIYTKYELTDRNNNPVRITDIPDRTKGISYGAPRSAISKQIITEQVISLAEHCFKNGLEFDEDNADWMIVPRFVLPKIWHGISATSPLQIVFPTEYPEIPPVGFYLKEDIPQSPDGHLYSDAYHDACQDPIDQGWKWYCVYVKPGSWSPSRYRVFGDWQRGDNLWTYFQLITEALSSMDD